MAQVSVVRIAKVLGVVFAVPLLLVVVVAVLVGWFSVPLAQGDDLPPLAGVTPDGAPVELSALRGGRPTVLNFWGTWCGPCVEELPIVDAFAHARPDVAVVGVPLDEPDEVQQFLRHRPLSYPQLVTSSSSHARWHVMQWPTTYFIDASGQVRAVLTTSMTAEQLQETAAAAFAQR